MNSEFSAIVSEWGVDVSQPSPIILTNRTRVDLARMFAQLKYRTGAEIGTARGSFAITISVNNPKCKLYCIDAWATYNGLNDYTDQKQLDEYAAAALHRLKPYKNIEIINDLSMDAVKRFDDESLDFVYIDANHEFPYIAEDLFHWEKKVRSGGIVAGHDYLKTPRNDGMIQVREVVNAYAEAFPNNLINPWFVVDECTQNKAGSFFWVKP